LRKKGQCHATKERKKAHGTGVDANVRDGKSQEEDASLSRQGVGSGDQGRFLGRTRRRVKIGHENVEPEGGGLTHQEKGPAKTSQYLLTGCTLVGQKIGAETSFLIVVVAGGASFLQFSKNKNV